MKLWESVIDRRVRLESNVSKNQFGINARKVNRRNYLHAKTTTERDLDMVVIDLEKAYGRVTQRGYVLGLKRNKICSKYIETVKDMFNGAVASVSYKRDTSAFPNTVGLHQG